MKLINWIKANKLSALLLLIVGYFLFGSLIRNFLGVPTLFSNIDLMEGVSKSIPSAGIGGGGGLNLGAPFMAERSMPSYDYAPAPDVSDRMVIEESHLSLQVKNVRETTEKITSYAQSIGGYMVNTNLSNPGEAPAGNITIRVPQTRMGEALSYLRGLSVKVVYENISGRDVTDQYVDIDARLSTLNRTKAKFETIFNDAAEISDILNIQRELINVQSQIDSLKGQQNYLEKSAQMAKMTVSLSTDEFSLPYAPSETFRPEVIFKTAVRSLVSSLRKAATLIIWVLVYSVIWVPVLLLYIYWKKRKSANPKNRISFSE